MTAIDGVWRIRHTDEQDQTRSIPFGPIEGRVCKVSSTDPRQLPRIYSGRTAIGDIGRFQCILFDDTATPVEEPADVKVMYTNVIDGVSREIISGNTLEFKGSATTEATSPGDPRQCRSLPYGFGGVLGPGSKVQVYVALDSADTLESEECYLRFDAQMLNNIGGVDYSRKVSWGILDGDQGDPTPYKTFGGRGNTETKDDLGDLIADDWTLMWQKTMGQQERMKIGWGPEVQKLDALPADRIWFDFMPDVAPTGNTLESEDSWVFRVPITLYNETSPTPVLRMLYQQDLTGFLSGDSKDRYTDGDLWTGLGYYQIPQKTKARLGWPQGKEVYLYADKA